MKKGIIKGFFGKFFNTSSEMHASRSKDPSMDIQEMQDALENVREELGGLHATTEKGFLEVGRKLQEIYGSSTGMTDLATAVVNSMTGDEIKTSISGLSTILEELKGHIGTSETGFDRISHGLGEYQHTLDNVNSFFEKFRTLVLNLEMLGFFTRVENAHLYSGDTGFTSLTNDVKALSKRIFEKSGQIQTKAQALSKLIKQALHEFAQFKESHKTQAFNMLDRSVSSHGILVTRHTSATTTAQSIAVESKGIMEEIGDIVSNLQFQDITSQQIEHVIEVIDSLQDSLDTSDLTDVEKAGLLSEVCGLQSAQIKNTQKEAYTAVQTVIESMQNISGHIQDLLEDTRKVTWASDVEGLTFMEELDFGISTVIECLNDNISEQTGLTNTMASVSSMVSEMSVFVGEIENLGLNLQLIALNARIKAAHIGNEGAALDTISGGIYELSKNSREDTSELSHMLASVVDIAKNFDLSLESMNTGQEQGVEDLVKNLKELLFSLHDMNDSVFTSLIQMNTMGESLREEINTAISGITIHEEMKDILVGVASEMEDISRKAKQLFPSAKRSGSSSFMKELEKYYTMESEHQIHADHFGTGKASASSSRVKPLKQSGSDLGDNVELF